METNQSTRTILNTSILTNYGTYSYSEISIQELKELLSSGFDSAIGHQSTCDILSNLLDVEVKLNRIQYSQKVKEEAIVFKLNGRLEESKIISVEEIEAIGYSFGLLKRLS